MKSEKPLARRKILEDAIDRAGLKSIIGEIAVNSGGANYADAGEYFVKRSAIARLADLDSRPSTPAVFIRDYIDLLIK